MTAPETSKPQRIDLAMWDAAFLNSVAQAVSEWSPELNGESQVRLGVRYGIARRALEILLAESTTEVRP